MRGSQRTGGSRGFIQVRKFSSQTRPYRHAGRIEIALALLISLIGVIASYLVADRVYERMPHIEDEVAYVWQARLIAHGDLTLSTPAHATSFLVPFVVQANGSRSGKYPLGWPAMLALGVRLGLRAWINPLLAGLGVWLTYRLGKRFFSGAVGLLAAGLTVTSPFFLMNSGSLLSHPFGLVLTSAFVLAWLDLFDRDLGAMFYIPVRPERPASQRYHLKPTLLVLTAGLSLGMLVLTRPFTAVGIAIPFGLHGLYLLLRGGDGGRSSGGEVHRRPLDSSPGRVLAIGLIVVLLSGLYFTWQYAVTGDPLKNPYVLWWSYDKIGFGAGYGVLAGGHNLPQALYNTGQSLEAGYRDLFGWGIRLPLDSADAPKTGLPADAPKTGLPADAPKTGIPTGTPPAPGFSWIFIPFGLWAITFGKTDGKRFRLPIGWAVNRQAWMLALSMVSLVILYMAYWIGSDLYGPRYYYEGLYAVTLISAAGIAFLAGWPVNARVVETQNHPSLRAEDVATEVQGVVPGAENDVSLPGASSRRASMVWGYWTRVRAGLAALVVTGLVIYNLAVYLPGRLQEMHALYGVSRQNLRQFQVAADKAQVAAQAERTTTPALIIVHSEKWHFYGALLELEDPYLTSPYIFAWSIQPEVDILLPLDYPGRAVYHYYQDEPGVLYDRPKNP